MRKMLNILKSVFLIPLTTMQRRQFIIACVTGFIYSAMLVAIPFMVSLILYSAENRTILGVQFNLQTLVAVLSAYCITTMLLYLLYEGETKRFVLSTKLSIEKKTVRYILELEKSPSKATNIINHDIPDFCNLYYTNIFKILTSFSFIVAGLIYSAIISVFAFLIEIVFLSAALALQLSLRSKISSKYDKFRKSTQQTIKGITSFINGKLTIQSNNAYEYASSSVWTLIKNKAEGEYGYLICKQTSNILINLIPIVATLFSSLLYANLIIEGSVKNKVALAGAYVVGYIIWELIKLVPLLNDLTTVKGIRDYICMVANLNVSDSRIMSTAARMHRSMGIQKIELRNVTVQRRQKTILRDISVDFVVPGKYLILGNSGSGKTTLLHAIMNMVDFTGSIFADTFSDDDFKNYINYLPQCVEVFPGSVSSNIAVNKYFQDRDVVLALKKANYDALNIGQNLDPFSVSFSGGELKKIAFARALFHSNNKPILLLDEPFEGLDQESKLIIEEEILKHKGLAIVVTHIFDLDFVKNFDKIIILESGAIIYCGHYESIPYSLKQHYFGQEKM